MSDVSKILLLGGRVQLQALYAVHQGIMGKKKNLIKIFTHKLCRWPFCSPCLNVLQKHIFKPSLHPPVDCVIKCQAAALVSFWFNLTAAHYYVSLSLW